MPSKRKVLKELEISIPNFPRDTFESKFSTNLKTDPYFDVKSGISMHVSLGHENLFPRFLTKESKGNVKEKMSGDVLGRDGLNTESTILKVGAASSHRPLVSDAGTRLPNGNINFRPNYATPEKVGHPPYNFILPLRFIKMMMYPPRSTIFGNTGAKDKGAANTRDALSKPFILSHEITGLFPFASKHDRKK